MWADLQSGLFCGHYTPDRVRASLAEAEREEAEVRARGLGGGGGIASDLEDLAEVDAELPPGWGRASGAASTATPAAGARPPVPAQRAITPSRVGGGRPASRASRLSMVECCSPDDTRTGTCEVWSMTEGSVRGRASPPPCPSGRPARRRQHVTEALPKSARASLPRRPASVCGAASARRLSAGRPTPGCLESPTPTCGGALVDHVPTDKTGLSLLGPSSPSPMLWEHTSSPMPNLTESDFPLQDEAGLVTRTNTEANNCTGAASSQPLRSRASRLLQRLSTNPQLTKAPEQQPPPPPRHHRRPVGLDRRGGAVVSRPAPEVSASTLETIRRAVCGTGPSGPSKLPADKQSSHVSDEIAKGARELRGWERERVASIFKELVVGSDDRREKPEHAVISSSEVARRLRGLLSSAHIQRLCHYFGFPKRMRFDAYMKRVSLFITSTREKRLRICFGLLDVDGDAVLGPRDVFAALSSSKGSAGACEVLDACFEDPGPVGLDFEEEADPAKPVRDVARAVPGSPAEEKGLQPGDRLTHINGVAVETLVPQEVRQRLSTFTRPLRLRFERQGKPGGGGCGAFAFADFERMLEALRARHRTTTRIRVTIASAKGLRQADAGGSKSDPYCVCEIVGKPNLKFKTKVINDCLDPQWNDERIIADYNMGDTLKFAVRDRDVGSTDELLGRASLECRRFIDNGFDGELKLLEAGRGISATLRVKVAVLGDGGIGYQHFSEVFGQDGLAFFSPLVKALTGLSPESTAPPRAAAPGVKIKVCIIGASRLRNADMVGKSDPYCICEVLGKPGNSLQTKVLNDTLDPVWNARGNFADFSLGDQLRFSVFDKDPKIDECLGQAKLLGPQCLPAGFEGELPLVDSGNSKDENHPVLKVRVTVAGSTMRRSSQASSIGSDTGVIADETAAEAAARHELELRELKGLPGMSAEAVAWYERTFEAFCDHKRTLQRGYLVAAALQLLGVPSGILAGRLFDLADTEGQGEVGILAWGGMLERFHAGHADETNYHKAALAFALYDLDGDTVIGAEDAGRLAQEVERLEAAPAPPGTEPGASAELREEMRWLYGLIADSMSTNQMYGRGRGLILDHWMFHQMKPHPALADIVLEHLGRLGRPHTAEAAGT